jgi:hypothetical protein
MRTDDGDTDGVENAYSTSMLLTKPLLTDDGDADGVENAYSTSMLLTKPLCLQMTATQTASKTLTQPLCY